MAKIIRVIEVNASRGVKDDPENPIRGVTEFWAADGDETKLGEFDPLNSAKALWLIRDSLAKARQREAELRNELGLMLVTEKQQLITINEQAARIVKLLGLLKREKSKRRRGSAALPLKGK